MRPIVNKIYFYKHNFFITWNIENNLHIERPAAETVGLRCWEVVELLTHVTAKIKHMQLYRLHIYFIHCFISYIFSK